MLRLMREAGLLAPTRVGRRRGPRNHDGTITTGHPDEMWGTDATACLTTREGNATVFIAVDHCTQECVGIHAARPGTRFEALEPLRQGLREHFGGYGAGVATGLALRHDHGSQYMSDHFQGELRFLGIRSSPSFVAAPEGNGCAERFIRTLKEQLLWVETFETVEQPPRAARVQRPLEAAVERHGHRTAAVRQALSPSTGAAASAYEVSPGAVHVYPSENYYYFILHADGRQIWGNIRLPAGRREHGVLSFGYFEFIEFPSASAQGVSGSKFYTDADGVIPSTASVYGAVQSQDRDVPPAPPAPAPRTSAGGR